MKRVKNMMKFEEKYSDYMYICGTDEVGRGPLAGPIVTAAVILPKGFVIPCLNDSKQVKKEVREELYAGAQLASIRLRSGQVSRGSAGEYQADERAGVARLSWRVSGR